MEYVYAVNKEEKPVSGSSPSGREEKPSARKEKRPLTNEELELRERMKEEEARLRAQFMFGWYY
ncbi:hypothetical protein SAMN02745823_01843 [Sporobacter termitidis DSM 10068]|uniref:Uncharacterized protein n=1 Tax=Sporobacter termitidis DSM 10068 TaxID=1123282 RepID=A0A1M5XIB5_9FIRM|nr:hypothetical protein [Sporobacter termitidis]SHH99541.1 hypothetical protein SAMN02745823_01843 [Sporobacter termitidis DSM 10068]